VCLSSLRTRVCSCVRVVFAFSLTVRRMQLLAAEFMGTFFLTLVCGTASYTVAAVPSGSFPVAPSTGAVAIGFAMMGLVRDISLFALFAVEQNAIEGSFVRLHAE
jgi:hypothetical protein